MKRESLSGEGKRFHFEENGKKKEGYRVYLIDEIVLQSISRVSFFSTKSQGFENIGVMETLSS
jgi:hypothetical protein